MDDFDWRTFDELLGYEVRRHRGVITIRDRDGRTFELTPAEFEQLRGAGPKPKGLQ